MVVTSDVVQVHCRMLIIQCLLVKAEDVSSIVVSSGSIEHLYQVLF